MRIINEAEGKIVGIGENYSIFISSRKVAKGYFEEKQCYAIQINNFSMVTYDSLAMAQYALGRILEALQNKEEEYYITKKI
nr:MAG TPA: hypothetical protein [Caudoviricetes sp.]